MKFFLLDVCYCYWVRWRHLVKAKKLFLLCKNIIIIVKRHSIVSVSCKIEILIISCLQNSDMTQMHLGFFVYRLVTYRLTVLQWVILNQKGAKFWPNFENHKNLLKNIKSLVVFYTMCYIERLKIDNIFCQSSKKVFFTTI